MEKNTKKTNWEIEANSFYTWFKNLGGDVSNDKQMTLAFKKIVV